VNEKKAVVPYALAVKNKTAAEKDRRKIKGSANSDREAIFICFLFFKQCNRF